MRKLLLILLFLPAFNIIAQISEGGYPKSFKTGLRNSTTVIPVNIPVNFSPDSILEENEKNLKEGKPRIYAKEIDTCLNTENSGEWKYNSDGSSIWIMAIRAEGAAGIILYFENFHIYKGGKLFIYNKKKSQVLGAFTEKTNPKTWKFATQPLRGDQIIIEYEAEPGTLMPVLDIKSIGYVFYGSGLEGSNSLRAGEVNTSCMVPIDCIEGAAWQNEKNGICEMIMKIGDKAYLCTGSVINNTAEDFKPYIISANHCFNVNGDTPSNEDLSMWIFKFHYEKVNCNYTKTLYETKSIVGCTKIANNPLNNGSDGLLLLLNDTIPDNYNVYYNGWDRTNNGTESGSCIHHPQGEEMCISTIKDKTENGTWNDQTNTGAPSATWRVYYKKTDNGHGVVLSGSSGSPLFNKNKLIIGTLTGGATSCSEEGTGKSSYFGKLYYHWDKYLINNKLEDSSRMDKYLDPLNTEKTTLNGTWRKNKPAPENLKIDYTRGYMHLNWHSPETKEKPESYLLCTNNEVLAYTTDTFYTYHTLTTGNQYSISAIYKDSAVSQSIFGNIENIKRPENPLEYYTGYNQITLSWNAPEYHKYIKKNNFTPYTLMTYENTDSLFFGNRWKSEETVKYHNRTIDSLFFYILTPNQLPYNYKGKYSLFVAQENKTYVQPLKSYKLNELNKVALTTPFPIEGGKDLFIGLKVTGMEDTEYPIVLDSDTAKIREGDIVSFDGKTWSSLHEISGQPYTNHNIIIKASVSSYYGNLSGADSIYTETDSSEKVFPEISGYKVYKNNLLYKDLPSQETSTSFEGRKGEHSYSVSAVISDYESDTIQFIDTIFVGLDYAKKNTIIPNIINDHVKIIGAGHIDKLEIIAINGIIVKTIKNPDEFLYVGDLKEGIYIFKFYCGNKTYKTKAIKK